MERTLHLVHTTLETPEDAARLAETLVGEGLTVCAQVGAAIRSWYRWQGRLETGTEIPLLLKVRGDRLAACCERLEALHPYETPEVLVHPLGHVARGYLDWAYSEEGP
ncbi:divalent cation tolerance protein CutA [bacterium]|nr:divalent cation tolerance protein CutA [bacterium]